MTRNHKTATVTLESPVVVSTDRSSLVRLAEVLEEVMCDVGKGETDANRKLWAACHPLWIVLQSILRRLPRTPK